MAKATLRAMHGLSRVTDICPGAPWGLLAGMLAGPFCVIRLTQRGVGFMFVALEVNDGGFAASATLAREEQGVSQCSSRRPLGE